MESHIYILKICSWGDFDVSHSRNLSAHLTEDAAERKGLSLGLQNSVSDDDDETDWFEVEKIELCP